jgi:hypothetical protein
MKSPEEVRKFAEKAYRSLLRAVLEGRDEFPLHTSVGRVDPEEVLGDRRALNALVTDSEASGRSGFRIVYRTHQTRKFGPQTLPDSIVFETRESLLAYLNKTEEFAAFRADCDLIYSEIPHLEAWIKANTHLVIQEHGVWKDLLLVCRYFLEHPKPGLYIRELPIEVHTKFVEEKQTVLRKLLDSLIPENVNSDTNDFTARYNLRSKEDLIRFRILDESIAIRHFDGLNDLSIPLSQFRDLDISECRNVIILENLSCFLSLPNFSGTVAIFGRGFALGNLSRVEWFKSKSILYWGDIDIQGFQILSLLRSCHPSTRSVLMDRETLSRFQNFATTGTESKVQSLSHLTDEEKATLELLIGFAPVNRLEQERIPFAHSNEKIREQLNRDPGENK